MHIKYSIKHVLGELTQIEEMERFQPVVHY